MSDLLVWRSVAIVSVLLIAVLGTVIAVRGRWPYRSVRITTTLILFFALVLSGFAVDSLILLGTAMSGGGLPPDSLDT